MAYRALDLQLVMALEAVGSLIHRWVPVLLLQALAQREAPVQALTLSRGNRRQSGCDHYWTVAWAVLEEPRAPGVHCLPADMAVSAELVREAVEEVVQLQHYPISAPQ